MCETHFVVKKNTDRTKLKDYKHSTYDLGNKTEVKMERGCVTHWSVRKIFITNSQKTDSYVREAEFDC